MTGNLCTEKYALQGSVDNFMLPIAQCVTAAYSDIPRRPHMLKGSGVEIQICKTCHILNQLEVRVAS
jgi:hypothetical protein